MCRSAPHVDAREPLVQRQTEVLGCTCFYQDEFLRAFMGQAVDLVASTANTNMAVPAACAVQVYLLGSFRVLIDGQLLKEH